MKKLLDLLNKNNIQYEQSGNYINILNSSVMARIFIKKYTMSGMEFIALYVQEFNELGEQIYNKEYMNLKPIVNRILKNVG